MPDEEKVRFERAEDFEDVYANNVRFESSVWDLKAKFGQLDLSNTPPEIIRLHTGVAMPWPTAKIMAYFMAVNVYIHQVEFGEIRVPAQVLPPRPDVSNPEIKIAREHIAYLAWLHDQFFGSDPYLPPEVAENAAEPQAK